MVQINGPSKHHYIPEFYLRYWGGDDGRFNRYDRPTPSKISVRRAFPSEAGWTKNLYSSPGDSNANWLEIDVFQVIDSRAAPVLRKINAEPPVKLNAEERSAWTVFIRSLFHRTPETLRATISSAIKIYEETLDLTGASYSELRASTDPETFAEYRAGLTAAQKRKTALNVIPSMMNNEVIGQFMNDMPTRLFTLPPQARDFLISDDPIARTNGLKKAGGHFAIPTSPRKLIVSAWQEDTLDQIANLRPDILSMTMNKSTVEGARYFVAARDISQDRFIRNHFGRSPRASILG
jgi:Protein of unknown function (DUF4238)